jgi:hypothetical protein
LLQFGNALSICLSECPTPFGTNGTNGTTVNGTANGTAASEARVRWVCKYPEDAGMVWRFPFSSTFFTSAVSPMMLFYRRVMLSLGKMR